MWNLYRRPLSCWTFYSGMAVKIKHDGRQVCDAYSYRKLRAKIYKEQGGCCKDCGDWFEFFDFELNHTGRGRGLGGGLREDRNVEGLCHNCHARKDRNVLYWSK